MLGALMTFDKRTLIALAVAMLVVSGVTWVVASRQRAGSHDGVGIARQRAGSRDGVDITRAPSRSAPWTQTEDPCKMDTGFYDAVPEADGCDVRVVRERPIALTHCGEERKRWVVVAMPNRVRFAVSCSLIDEIK
jgi:hypothetical protein